MDLDPAAIGRLGLDPPLDEGLSRELAERSRWWRAAEDGSHLVLCQVVERPAALEPAVSDLRALVRTMFRLHQLVVDGMLVLSGPDGHVLSVTVHRNRVTHRQLWPPPHRRPPGAPAHEWWAASEDGCEAGAGKSARTRTEQEPASAQESPACAVIDLATRVRRR